MQTFALIRDGVVAEVVQVPADTPSLEDRYHPDLLPSFVELSVPGSESVADGWLYDGSTFSAPPEPAMPAPAPEMTKSQILAEVQRLMALVQAMPA